MPRFEPFPGIRYASGLDPAVVTSPPYDVIDEAERAALAASHPANAVHVDCPVADLGSGREGEAAGGHDPYAEAAATFERWRTDGTLVTDDVPTFTIYRMSFTDETGRSRTTTGVLGALTLERPGDGGILPHERTTPKAKSDRLDLLRTTKANLSAIWGLSLAGGLSGLLEPSGPPTIEFTDPDGVRHEAWTMADPGFLAAVSAAVASAPVVIADGHHRYETCLTYRDEAPPDVIGAGATLCYVVELVEEQLTVQPIHRLLSGLPAGFDLPGALAAAYEVEPVDVVEPGQLGVVTADGHHRLRPRADDGTLDTVRLDEALAALPDHDVAFQHGVGHVVAAVTEGRADAGVLLRPVTVEQISAVADEGERMPPKTTFFSPKPRTGIVFRSLR